MTEMKTCCKCGETYPKTTEYFRRKPDGSVKSGSCKKCHVEYVRAWKRRNPEKYRAQNSKQYHRKKQKVREDLRRSIAAIRKAGCITPAALGQLVDHLRLRTDID